MACGRRSRERRIDVCPGLVATHAHRLGLVLSRLRDEDMTFAMSERIDPLRDLRVGLNLAELKRVEGHLSPTARSGFRCVAANVALVYHRYDDRHANDLSASIDAAIGSLATEPPSV